MARTRREHPRSAPLRVFFPLCYSTVLGWERRRDATCEAEKTGIIHFTRKVYRPDSEPFQFKGQLVQPETQVKVLGVIMGFGFKYEEHIARAATKGLETSMDLQRLRGLSLETANPWWPRGGLRL